MKQVTINFPENLRDVQIITHVADVPFPGTIHIVPREVVTDRVTVNIDEYGRIEICPISSTEFLNSMREILKCYEKDNDGQMAHERARALMYLVLREKGYHEGLEVLDRIKPY